MVSPRTMHEAKSVGTALFSTVSRQKRISSLVDWGKSNQIQIGGVAVQSLNDNAGLGLVATQQVPSGAVIVAVPSKVALSVESPGGGPDDFGVSDLITDRRIFRDLPWYVQFSLYLHKLDKVSSSKFSIDLRPWLDSLPRQFDTPIHWRNVKERDEFLQYQHMSESVDRQDKSWRDLYNKLQASTKATSMTWEDFLWGCECARSRAFSGGYTGAPFNPLIYAFTLLLVTGYLGLGLGSFEDAANGAAFVFCATVLRDFVLPKFFRVKKYVICPLIDMCNHNGITTSANVAYEFFADAYSLSATQPLNSAQEVFISYGSRSNDQLLQYYGFVEPDNPHDVYIMPPLREWDIAALEQACGAPFAPGRLGKLERAGLLGKPVDMPVLMDDKENDGLESAGNPRGGVVLTRTLGIDPAVIQALRALVSSDAEWVAAGEAVGNFATQVSSENERKARLAARTAIELELAAKPTTIEEDLEIMKRNTRSKSDIEPNERLALQFRIEKKKLLKETIEKLR